MKEKLLDELIYRIGFEHPYVITFARMVERDDVNEEQMKMLFDSIMTVMFD